MKYLRLLGWLPALLTLCAADAAAAAEQASQWAESMHSRARLVRGIDLDGGVYEVGVQIELDPGWKTYWRMPGDAGIPPEFDFSRSRNIDAPQVSWPAPQWFQDAYGWSVGYHDEVVFPVQVSAADPSVTPRLELTLHYAVCLDICIPARAELALDLEDQRTSPLHAGLIARFAATVPAPADPEHGLAVTAVSPALEGGRLVLVADIRCEDPERELGVFVEGPEKYYFGRPVRMPDAPPGHARYGVPVTGADAVAELAGARLNFVLVDRDTQVTQPWPLQ